MNGLRAPRSNFSFSCGNLADFSPDQDSTRAVENERLLFMTVSTHTVLSLYAAGRCVDITMSPL